MVSRPGVPYMLYLVNRSRLSAFTGGAFDFISTPASSYYYVPDYATLYW